MLRTTKALAVGTCILLALVLAAPGSAVTIPFSTMFNDVQGPPLIPGAHLTAGQQDLAFTWNYTGSYASPRLPTNILVFNGNNQITVCSGGACGSNGGNYGFGQTYTGYEFIYFGFQLPADASNVSLQFTSWVDDRAIVDLNGHLLGGWGIDGYNGATAWHSDGSGLHLVTFNGGNGTTQTFSTQSWFTPGDVNYIRFWINNTGGGIYGTAYPNSYNDPSALQVYGAITFDEAAGTIPEPGAFVLVGLGLLGVSLLPRRAPRPPRS